MSCDICVKGQANQLNFDGDMMPKMLNDLPRPDLIWMEHSKKQQRSFTGKGVGNDPS